MSDVENDFFCYVCAKPENDLTRLIECSLCGKNAHFRCKKLFGNAATRAKSRPYFCSAECSEMCLQASKQAASNEDIFHELKLLGKAVKEVRQDSERFRLAFEQTQHQISEIVTTSKQIERSQEFLAEQFDHLQADFKSFKEEMGCVKAENSKIRKELQVWKDTCKDLVGTVDRLEIDLDKINRASKMKNAVVLGIPMLENENTVELVSKLCEVVKCDFIGTTAIVSARRIIGKQPSNGVSPILVSFNSEQEKEELFLRKRAYGVILVSSFGAAFKGSTRTVTIRDELTAYGRELLQRTKNLQETLKIKYVWPGRGGKILIKRQDGSKVEQISSKLQLADLPATNFKRALNVSGASPPIVPEFKR